MSNGYILSLVVLGVVLVLTTYTELQSSRIPNWITTPALAFAFVASFIGIGIPLSSSVLGFLAGFGFLFVFYMFGGMGGGDVKLMGVVGALLGFPQIVTVLMYTAFIGGAMAVIALIWHKRFWSVAGRTATMFWKTEAGKTLDDGAVEDKPVTLPYGLAIVLGCIMHIAIGAKGLQP